MNKLVYIVILLLFQLNIIAENYKFYTINDGLSSSQISYITQDSEGYIWIATEDGLNRFNGYDFTIFRNVPGDTSSIPHNHVRCIFEDDEKRLWVATIGGLSIYDKSSNTFHPYRIYSYDKSEEYIQFYYIMQDKEGYIWIAASGKGVIRLNPNDGKCQYFNTTNSDICSDHINIIYEDYFGNIWFGSGQNGISIYNVSNGVFRTYNQLPCSQNIEKSNIITSICEDNEKNIWLATLTEGICKYSVRKKTFTTLDNTFKKNSYLLKDRKNNIWVGSMGHGFTVYNQKTRVFEKTPLNLLPIDITQSKVDNIFEDKQGNIWMGVYLKGLLRLSPGNNLFYHYSSNAYTKDETIPEGAIQPLYCDSKGDIWLGVDAKGMYRLNSDKKIIKKYQLNNNQSFFNDIPISIFEDSKQNIWIGTYLGGIIHFDRKRDLFDFTLLPGKAPFGLSASNIKYIIEDKDGKLWIATNGGGINIYDPDTKKIKYLRKDETDSNTNQLIDNWCNQICIDKDSLYWIATYRGLSLYNAKNNKFTNYSVKNKMLPNDAVLALYKDKAGLLWVGTQNGLARFSKDRSKVDFYHISNGLPNAMVTDITEDSYGNLWIITKTGLAVYHPQKDTFTKWSAADGLQNCEFMINSLTRTKQGEFLVGTSNGFTGFFPQHLNNLKENPIHLYFSNLYILNEKIDVNTSTLSHKMINNNNTISLNYDQNSFAVEVSAIEFIYPEKVHYEAYLEGFDNQYHPIKNRLITYTKLAPGNYNLYIKAWINDKDQALEKTLTIEIKPPLWATFWAKLAYFIIFILFAYMLYRNTKKRITEKRKEELMQTKLQFFTDISHEIRTPLTLIISPLRKLILKCTDPELLQTYHRMHTNGTRLLQLVNQVMDLRAVEFGKKTLAIEEQNITNFMADLKNSFTSLADEKGISYAFNSSPENIKGYIDTDILSKILYNLISNAFKFTEKGKIDVSITEEKGLLKITITDTGVGIPLEQQKFIFDRFYMIDNSIADRSQSSGIGLHLTRRLVELHHGTISLNSEIEKGSTFNVCIPIKKEAYPISSIVTNRNHTSDILQPFSNLSNSSKEYPSRSNHNLKTTLLIVDDNEDIRKLIVDEFHGEYNLLEATNGEEALRIIIEKEPNIIVSDVIMPQMDGIELCRKVRNNDNIRHIPFILLTALTTIEQQIEGIENGADVYIPKPFDILYLRASVERLLKSREELRKKYLHSCENILTETKPASESKEEKFINSLNQLIDEQIDNPDLNVDILCEKLAISRTHLNRKVKELTGESPATHIRRIRLQKASFLLKTKDLTVSEIAYSIGFSSPSYFCQAFREYYGVSPKDYMNL